MIGIIGFCELRGMQYLKRYTNLFDKYQIEYEVVYWKRCVNDVPVFFNGAAISYDKPFNDAVPFFRKIGHFAGYVRFLRKILHQKRYSKLIVLTTQTAIPISDILLKKYKRNYLYDYRDITKEKKFFLYNGLVKKLILNSHKTMMSSKGYLKEIGLKDDSLIVQANNTQTTEFSMYNADFVLHSPIRLAYWGFLRQPNYIIKICDIFGNDPRYVVKFHGVSLSPQISNFCLAKGFGNIDFTGAYSLDDIPKFVQETDILICLYENDVTQRSALPVKVFDAIRYKLPVLVTKDSYLAQYMNGISGCKPIDLSTKDVATHIFDWYRSLNRDTFYSDYSKLESIIFHEDKVLDEEIMGYASWAPKETGK